MNIQNHNQVFVFDMDNTLIKTDKANNLAYSEAISAVLNVHYSLNSDTRFTRDLLKEVFPNLNSSQFDEIITRKERCFESYLKETELNLNLFNILKMYHREGRHTILLTNSHYRRAVSLCNYYGLTKYFVQRFFFEDYPHRDKYKFLIDKGYELESVVLFENEEFFYSQALECGVNKHNIIQVDF